MRKVAIATWSTIGLASLGLLATIHGPRAEAQTPSLGTTSTNPLWTRDVDEARQPVQKTATVHFLNGNFYTGNGSTSLTPDPTPIWTVPAGKRLVIEYASVLCSMPADQSIFFELDTTVGTDKVHHGLSPTNVSLLHRFGTPVRFYADTGTQVLSSGTRTQSVGNSDCDVSISGFLVNVP